MKEALLHFWEEYRPGGDETDLYERILKEIEARFAPKDWQLGWNLPDWQLQDWQANVNKMLQEEEDGI